MEPTELERLRRGDARWLLDTYLDDLYRFLRQLTRHRQEAEDLTQQTLLRALRGAFGFDGRCALRTWLHRIAYREYLNWRRGKRVLLAIDPRHLASGRSADDLLSREALLAALARLSPKVQAAFLLVEVQELTVSEAAVALDVPEGTVKSRLFEARARLRDMLRDTFEEVSHA